MHYVWILRIFVIIIIVVVVITNFYSVLSRVITRYVRAAMIFYSVAAMIFYSVLSRVFTR